MRDARRLRHLWRFPPDWAGVCVLEQADATGKQHRYEMDVQLVDQASSQALAADVASHDGNIAATCGRSRRLIRGELRVPA